MNYCVDNFYSAFFKSKEFGSDFGDDKIVDDFDFGVKNRNNGFKNDGNDSDSIYDECSEFRNDDDESIYEDIDTSRHWGMLDVIQEESDSDYYRSVDYCNAIFKRNRESNERNIKNNDDNNDNVLNNKKDDDFETIIANCKGYLEGKPKILPKTISDKIHNFKKDFSNHDYVNVNFDNAKIRNDDNDKNHYDNVRIRNTKVENHYVDNNHHDNDKNNQDYDKNHHDYENVNFDKQGSPNINLDRRIKNDLLRERFFLSSNIDKNNINDQFNKYDKKIECHSIRNDVTHNGPSTKVSGSLNMKILNHDKYNRVLTTTETFMETAEASFTKNEIGKRKGDNFENFVKKSERYFTSESRDRQTKVELNSSNTKDRKGMTEIRIVYNPTFNVSGEQYIRGFCHHCKRRCPRTEQKCCSKCECLELEFQQIWKENWLNILLILALIFVFIAVSIQCMFFKNSCERSNGTEVGECFEIV